MVLPRIAFHDALPMDLHPMPKSVADSLQQQLRDALNRARKDRERARTIVLSSTLSEIRNREIELGGVADGSVVRDVIARSIRQRREAAEQMRAGGREELALKEEGEATMLTAFLPPQLTEDEIREMIRQLVADGATGVGPVMGKLAPLIRGRFEGREANRIVKEELAG